MTCELDTANLVNEHAITTAAGSHSRVAMAVCGTCDGCCAAAKGVGDCKSCLYCLDKPKYGGPFKIKQKCMGLWCLHKLTASHLEWALEFYKYALPRDEMVVSSEDGSVRDDGAAGMGGNGMNSMGGNGDGGGDGNDDGASDDRAEGTANEGSQRCTAVGDDDGVARAAGKGDTAGDIVADNEEDCVEIIPQVALPLA